MKDEVAYAMKYAGANEVADAMKRGLRVLVYCQSGYWIFAKMGTGILPKWVMGFW